MWGFRLGFRSFREASKNATFLRNGLLRSRVPLGITFSAPFLFGAIVANDNSESSLAGVSVDSSIDPFPTSYSAAKSPFLSSDHTLVATGIRSVTFVGFKVYGVGLYVSEKQRASVKAIVSEYVQQKGKSAEELLNDKEVSQQIISDISQKVPYALKITPVRNTDYGHLRDGLTKSILANPLAKSMREEVGRGLEQLRSVFVGFKGSVPKNDTLWVISNTKETSIVHEGKEIKTMGTVTEPCIARVLLVSYLSSVKPLSEPLRKDFVSYVTK